MSTWAWIIWRSQKMRWASLSGMACYIETSRVAARNPTTIWWRWAFRPLVALGPPTARTRDLGRVLRRLAAKPKFRGTWLGGYAALLGYVWQRLCRDRRCSGAGQRRFFLGVPPGSPGQLRHWRRGGRIQRGRIGPRSGGINGPSLTVDTVPLCCLGAGAYLLWRGQQPAWLERVGRGVTRHEPKANGWQRMAGRAASTAGAALWITWPGGLMQSALMVAALANHAWTAAATMAGFALAHGTSLACGPALWFWLGRIQCGVSVPQHW
jgi:hypothetical protein